KPTKVTKLPARPDDDVLVAAQVDILATDSNDPPATSDSYDRRARDRPQQAFSGTVLSTVPVEDRRQDLAKQRENQQHGEELPAAPLIAHHHDRQRERREVRSR